MGDAHDGLGFPPVAVPDRGSGADGGVRPTASYTAKFCDCLPSQQ